MEEIWRVDGMEISILNGSEKMHFWDRYKLFEAELNALCAKYQMTIHGLCGITVTNATDSPKKWTCSNINLYDPTAGD